MADQEEDYLKNAWWVLTVRGVAAILFGIAAVFWPQMTLVTLVYLFSAYIMVFGIVDIIHGLSNIRQGGLGWILTMLLGFLEVGVGVYLLRHTLVAFSTLILLIGFTFVVRGILEIVMAFSDDKMATSKTLLIIGGVITVLAGIIILRQPAASGVAFVWVLGVFALITGPMLIAMAMDAKRLLNELNVNDRTKGSRTARAQ